MTADLIRLRVDFDKIPTDAKRWSEFNATDFDKFLRDWAEAINTGTANHYWTLKHPMFYLTVTPAPTESVSYYLKPINADSMMEARAAADAMTHEFIGAGVDASQMRFFLEVRVRAPVLNALREGVRKLITPCVLINYKPELGGAFA